MAGIAPGYHFYASYRRFQRVQNHHPLFPIELRYVTVKPEGPVAAHQSERNLSSRKHRARGLHKSRDPRTYDIAPLRRVAGMTGNAERNSVVRRKLQNFFFHYAGYDNRDHVTLSPALQL